MATPVMPSQFAVGKSRIIHKPTTATFSFEIGHTTFKSINWGRADDIIRVAQQLLSKLAKVRERHEAARVHHPAGQRARAHRPFHAIQLHLSSWILDRVVSPHIIL